MIIANYLFVISRKLEKWKCEVIIVGVYIKKMTYLATGFLSAAYWRRFCNVSWAWAYQYARSVWHKLHDINEKIAFKYYTFQKTYTSS